MFDKILNLGDNKKLHWTTVASEKILLAVIGIATCVAAALYLWEMLSRRQVLLEDLFMLFIYAEILGMVGAFYSTTRIPVTLPIIIAITAICRLIVMQNKDVDATLIIGEAGAVLILAGASYVMSLKEKLSLEKKRGFESHRNAASADKVPN